MEHNGPNHILDVVITQVTLDNVTAQKLLELLSIAESTLSRAEEHHPAVELFAASLGHFLNVGSEIVILVDELLNFVQDNEGARQFAFFTQCFANSGEHFRNRNVLVFILVVAGQQGRTNVGHCAEVRVTFQICLRYGFGGVKPFDLLVGVDTRRLKVFPKSGLLSIPA